ncbi:hypothetical protein [Chryseobacterium sp. 22543]
MKKKSRALTLPYKKEIIVVLLGGERNLFPYGNERASFLLTLSFFIIDQ